MNNIDVIKTKMTHPSNLKLLSLIIYSLSLVSLLAQTWLSLALFITTFMIAIYCMNEFSKWSISHPFAIISIVILIRIIGPLFDFLFIDPSDISLLLGRSRKVLVYGGFVSLVGIGSLIYGYSMPISSNLIKYLPNITNSWEKRSAIGISYFFLFIGLISFTFVLYSISFHEISSKRQFSTVYIRWFVQFLVFGSMILYITILEYKETLNSLNGFITIFGLISYFTFGFIVSDRSAIMWNLILILAIHVQYRRLNAAPLIGISVIIMVLSSIMIALRSDADSLIDFLVPIPILESVFGADRGGITVISHLVYMSPTEIPYRYGKTLFNWIVFPIPRAFWNAKPENLGNELVTLVYGINRSGAPPKLIGDLYLNFSIFGVIIGMFIFGIFLRIVVSYRSQLRNTPSVILLTTVLIVLAGQLMPVTKLIVNIGMWMVPLVVAVLIIRASPLVSKDEFIQTLPTNIQSSWVVEFLFLILVSIHRIGSVASKLIDKPKNNHIINPEYLSSSMTIRIISKFNQTPEDQIIADNNIKLKSENE